MNHRKRAEHLNTQDYIFTLPTEGAKYLFDDQQEERQEKQEYQEKKKASVIKWATTAVVGAQKDTVNDDILDIEQMENERMAQIEPVIVPAKQDEDLRWFHKSTDQIYDVYFDILMGSNPNKNMDLVIQNFYNPGDRREIDQLQLNYLDEEYYHMGDLVIKFPNPDSEKYKYNDEENTITYRKKDQIFQKLVLNVDQDDRKEIADIKLLQRAYDKAFTKLLTYHTAKDETRIHDLEKKIEKLKKIASRTKDPKRKEFLLNPKDPQNPIFQLNKLLDKNKERKFQGGGEFMQLMEDKEDNLVQTLEIEPEQYIRPWEYTGYPTQDFCTLIRHLIWLRLIKAYFYIQINILQIGFKIRNFLSQSGEEIYTVLYSNDENLKITAQNDQFIKSLNFNLSDILSLEPVDQTFRPLRLHNLIWQDIQDEIEQKQDLTEEELQRDKIEKQKFEFIRSQMEKFIKGINFKKISRETNTQKIFEKFQDNQYSQIINVNYPNDLLWKLYYEYLLYLFDKIQNLRREFYLDNKSSLQINRIMEKDDLYRFKKKQDVIKKKKEEEDLKKLTEKMERRKKNQLQKDGVIVEVDENDEYDM